MVSALCNSSFYRSHKLLNAMEQTDIFGNNIYRDKMCDWVRSNSLLCADSFCSQDCKVSWPSLIGTNSSTSDCTQISNLKYTQWTDCQAFQEHFGFIRKYQPVWQQFIVSNSIMLKDLVLVQHIALGPISPALQEINPGYNKPH